VLLILTMALLILPGTYHRIVENGNASAGFLRITGLVTSLALVPFAASLGIDIGIAGQQILGSAGAVAAAALVGALAILFWFGSSLRG